MPLASYHVKHSISRPASESNTRNMSQCQCDCATDSSTRTLRNLLPARAKSHCKQFLNVWNSFRESFFGTQLGTPSPKTCHLNLRCLALQSEWYTVCMNTCTCTLLERLGLRPRVGPFGALAILVVAGLESRSPEHIGGGSKRHSTESTHI